MTMFQWQADDKSDVGWALASEYGDYGLQTRKLTAETWKWSLKEREIHL